MKVIVDYPFMEPQGPILAHLCLHGPDEQGNYWIDFAVNGGITMNCVWGTTPQAAIRGAGTFFRLAGGKKLAKEIIENSKAKK